MTAVAVAGPPRVAGMVRALARIEGVRVVRHPIFLAGLALAFLLAYGFPLGSEIGGDYLLLAGIGSLPVALSTLLVVNLAALRTPRSETGELFASLSAPARTRSLAHLSSVAAAVAVCACLVAAGFVAFGAWDGIVVDYGGSTQTPSLLELANGPAGVAALGALGLTLARWIPYLPIGPLGAVAVFVAQIPGLWNSQRASAWFAPFVNPARHADPTASWPCSPTQSWPCSVDEFATASAGWHAVYLVGVAIVLAALALWKDDRRPRVLAVGVLGGCLALAAGILQVP